MKVKTTISKGFGLISSKYNNCVERKMWETCQLVFSIMKLLNGQYENKFTFMKSTEYEERLSNHYSLVIYGASIVLDVLKLNAWCVFSSNSCWALAQMPKLWRQLKALCGFLIHRFISVFQYQNWFTSTINKVVYIVFLGWRIGLMWTLESISLLFGRWRLFRDLEPMKVLSSAQLIKIK